MEPLFIAILALSAISVFRAEESLFVRKGSSVRLDVQGYEKLQLRTIIWTFNSEKLVDFNLNIKHLESFVKHTRVVFDQNNFSLLLKNVQETESGIYTATITDDNGEQIPVASYRLTVQEAPPTPQVRVVLLSSAGGFCNVSVNCSANNTWASYTCGHAHCTQVVNTTSLTGVNIIVMATNGTVHCSSRNRVDTKMRSESTKDVCSVPPVTPSPGLSLCALMLVLFLLGLVPMVSAVIAVHARDRCCRDQRGHRKEDKSVREEIINI